MRENHANSASHTYTQNTENIKVEKLIHHNVYTGKNISFDTAILFWLPLQPGSLRSTLTPALDCTPNPSGVVHGIQTNPRNCYKHTSLGHPLIAPSIPPNAESHNITRVTAALLDVAGSYVILQLCEHKQSGLSDMTAMYHTTNRGQGMLISHHTAHHTSHHTPQDTTPQHTTPHTSQTSL